MYEDSYLVPANAKKGTLIFNLFRKIDLVIFAIGVALTFVLLMRFASDSLVSIILSLIPAGIATFLVIPIPNYHNVLCAIQSIISFYTERRRFVWKGWCVYERFIDDSKK